jgi:hypothetical protein
MIAERDKRTGRNKEIKEWRKHGKLRDKRKNEKNNRNKNKTKYKKWMRCRKERSGNTESVTDKLYFAKDQCPGIITCGTV